MSIVYLQRTGTHHRPRHARSLHAAQRFALRWFVVPFFLVFAGVSLYLNSEPNALIGTLLFAASAAKAVQR